MRAFLQRQGEVFLVMSYPEAELLCRVIDDAAAGIGCHRGAPYVSAHLAEAFRDALPLPLEVVEETVTEEADRTRKKRTGKRKVRGV